MTEFPRNLGRLMDYWESHRNKAFTAEEPLDRARLVIGYIQGALDIEPWYSLLQSNEAAPIRNNGVVAPGLFVTNHGLYTYDLESTKPPKGGLHLIPVNEDLLVAFSQGSKIQKSLLRKISSLTSRAIEESVMQGRRDTFIHSESLWKIIPQPYVLHH